MTRSAFRRPLGLDERGSERERARARSAAWDQEPAKLTFRDVPPGTYPRADVAASFVNVFLSWSWQGSGRLISTGPKEVPDPLWSSWCF